jgi:signal transduction histidine kinase/DNA-binding response OmpR family regulator
MVQCATAPVASNSMPSRWPFGSATTIHARIQWLVVACAVPVALLAAVLLLQSYERGREALQQANMQRARSLVAAVDHELSATIHVLQVLAASTTIDERDYRRFHMQARETLKYVGADNIVLFDPELNGLASAAHPWGTPLPKVQHDRFPQVLRTLQPAVSDMFVGQVSKQQQVAVAVPVLRDGRAIGRLEMVFTLRRFADLLGRQHLAPTWTGALLDAQGTIVARSRDPEGYVGHSANATLLDNLRRAEEGTFVGPTADGIASDASFSRVGEHGWAAAIGVPVTELYAPLRRSLWVYGAISAVLLGAALLVARALGRAIAAPIQALVNPALAIGRGESTQLADSTLHEARELTSALQQAQALLLEREQARQRAEEAQRASESRLRMALDAAEIGDWDIDLATGAIRHSLQHDRCYGSDVPITDWSAERFFASIHPDDRERIRAAVRRTTTQKLPWLEDFRVVWPDGSVHWLTSQGTFLSKPGEPGFIVGVVMDNTLRKRAEELRLHSVRLEAENRQIQEANRLKSEFLANMSHELRTPLNAVIGFADILRGADHKLPEAKRAEYLGHIASSGRHLLRLINDVLDLSKVEAGKFELIAEPVPLARLVHDVVAVLQPEATQKRLQMSVQVDPALGEVVLDPARLKQMLYNLLSNAIKFTGEGGRVQLRALPEGEQLLRIEVEDTGIGIAAADLPKLFSQFQQLHGGLARPYPGSGLGLVLTRHLAELHGGSVGVRSTPGVGSVFHIVLPRRLPAAPAHEHQASAPATPSDAPAVLVIEDDAADRLHLTQILQGAGYQVELAPNAARALELAAARRYDAITLDLLLPDRSGLEVLNELRREGLNREVPVVVITIVSETSALAGFAVSDVLAKPIRPHEVRTALRRLGGGDEGLHVMVVDDDPTAVQLMVATLQAQGFSASVAHGGAQALELIEQQAPDAVILDLMMPGMNGFDVLHALRQRPDRRTLPVFVWTAMQLGAEELSALEQSARAVVGKVDGGLDVLVRELHAWQATT